MIISHAGISGSAVLGRGVIIAGQVGVAGHVTIGDRVMVGAQAGVTKSVAEGQIMLGSPAKPIFETKRSVAALARLPALFKEFAALKKKVDS